MDASVFDGYVAADGYYVRDIHASNQRILVLTDLFDHTNRDLADIVLYVKNGLVNIMFNKIGPPSGTFPIPSIYILKLITPLINTTAREEVPDLDDGFVGETDDDDFDPTHFDPNPNVEPV